MRFTLNGRTVSLDVVGTRRLLDALREDLHLTGTKEGCGEGECGACSVLIDGEVVDSCLIAVGQVEGREVTTVGLQQAFIEHGAAQCGICTPGMLLAAHVLVQQSRQLTADDVREGLAGNLCRCTGYTKIIDAVLSCTK